MNINNELYLNIFTPLFIPSFETYESIEYELNMYIDRQLWDSVSDSINTAKINVWL